METLIQPKILKGFRDFLPNQEIYRSGLINKLTQTYQSYGFVPIDTPVLEYTEILLRKSNGETEKQVYRFTDNGGRDIAMRFDLTVPFARFTAEHKDELYFPFKRYHCAKVWRGEKPQAGRYREFIQCDFDIVGSDSSTSDFEILSLMKAALNSIGVNNITIKINHRGIFNIFLKKLGLLDKSEDILRIVDKLGKIGQEGVNKELQELFSTISNDGKDENYNQRINGYNEIGEYISSTGNYYDTLSKIAKLAGEEAEPYVQRMKDLRTMMEASGIETTFELDPAITRGLDYYTGIVYETFLNDCPSIGSVCSGGRYDNLAGLYMKDKVPGVGASIGLDRLIAGLEQLGLTQQKGSYLDAEIFNTDSNNCADYQKVAAELRELGIAVEVYPDAKKINQQYTLAEKKTIPWGILVNNYSQSGLITIKNLKTREQKQDISVKDAAKFILDTKE